MARRVVTLLLAAMLAGTPPVAAAGAVSRAPDVISVVMQIHPTSGPGGTLISVRAKDLDTNLICARWLEFIDSTGVTTNLRLVGIDKSFHTTVTIPASAAPGAGSVLVLELYAHNCHNEVTEASAVFTVTSRGVLTLASRPSGLTPPA